MNSFQGKRFDGVIFVDPFLQFALTYLLVKVNKIVFRNVFVLVCVSTEIKGEIIPFFQQPGELDYAELDDFRPSVQPAAAAAEAAPARPLIRRPAYEGTEYADITQFGVPQPEPTYGNIPKKDVVYSNVQGI